LPPAGRGVRLAHDEQTTIWFVVVKGGAAGVTLIQEVLDTVELLLFPWQAGRKDAFVRIVPTTVSGRRFKVAPPLTWWTPLDDAARAGME